MLQNPNQCYIRIQTKCSLLRAFSSFKHRKIISKHFYLVHGQQTYICHVT